MQSSSDVTSPSRMRWALGGSVVLVVAGLAAFGYASRMARHGQPAGAAGNGVTITVRDGLCDPAQLSVLAGRTTFTIVNQSARVVEWEILDGVMVLEERENIAPGFSQSLTAKLSPGSYQITCGLLSNPRGTLTVTPSAASNLEASKPPVASFVGPLAEYRVYTLLETGNLLAHTQALAQAIRAGQLDQARTLYAPAHQAYEHIAPAAQLFADLDTRINARAEYFEKREADPAFAGFQRLAVALFQQNNLQGQAAVATQLVTDVQTLQTRLQGLQLSPDRLAASALRRAQSLSDAGHGPQGFADLPSQLAGIEKIVSVLRPLLLKAQPDLPVALDVAFAALPSSPDAAQQLGPSTLAAPLQALAQQIAKINPALGLE